MAVYMVIDIEEILDAATYAEYIALVPATVEQHGGRYLARGSSVTPLGGDWRPERMIIIEFPSLDHIRRWTSSPEYQALAPIRVRSTRGRAIAVDGLTR